MTTITIERAVLLRALEALRPATAPNGAKRDAAFEDLRAALAAPATAPDELERLRKDAEQMREALMFYAEGDHFTFDRDAWDTVSDEPQNYWCDEAGTATVEDGTIAKLALDAAMKETP